MVRIFSTAGDGPDRGHAALWLASDAVDFGAYGDEVLGQIAHFFQWCPPSTSGVLTVVLACWHLSGDPPRPSFGKFFEHVPPSWVAQAASFA
jgi:hypothetical protein